MKRQIELAGDKIIVQVAGKMYSEDADALRGEMLKYLDQGLREFIFDFQELEYISSSGIGMLLATKKATDKLGGTVKVCNLTGVVKELFEITRIAGIFG